MDVAVEASLLLSDHAHKGLVVTLADERYGAVGHADSNWTQLAAKGFVLPDALLLPVLVGLDRKDAETHFEELLEREIKNTLYRIGLFGIGPDGHTAGILPKSAAASADSLACAYTAGKFERITMTPKAIAMLDEAVVFADGPEKWPTLAQLHDDATIEEQPAQALKRVPKITLFTDSPIEI